MNGKLGGRPKTQITQQVKLKPRKPDTVTVTDKVTVKDTVNVIKDKEAVFKKTLLNFQDKYGNREIYGLTKDTGIEAHAIAYAKPLFVNYDYQVDICLESTTIKFRDKWYIAGNNSIEINFKAKIETKSTNG